MPMIEIFNIDLSKAVKSALIVATLCLCGLISVPSSSIALNSVPAAILGQQAKAAGSDLLKVRAVVRRGGAARRTTVVGPRGGVASRTVVRRGAVVRPGYAGGGVRWARPGRYYWPRGGAIAAGAAIGFATAATAAAWAGAAPAAGDVLVLH